MKRRKSNMKVSKKKIMLTAVVLLVSVLGIIGLNAVYAALKDSDQETNDFQLANLRGDITEKFTPPTKDKPIKPGDSYEKEVKVTNTENTPFFVRLLAVPEIKGADGVHLPSEIGEEVLINLNKDWVLGEDGFYYYLKKVSEGESTSPVFTTVTLSDKLSLDYTDAAMEIAIKSETITSAGNNYRDAWWQSKVPTSKNLKRIDSELQKIKGEK